MSEFRLQAEKLKLKIKRQQAKFDLKNQKLIISILVLVFGLGWLVWHYRQLSQSGTIQQARTDSSLVGLRSLSSTERSSQLRSLASTKNSRNLSPDQLRERDRARYLLAVDSIDRGQSEEALTYLQELKDEYSLLRPQIIFNMALAYRQNKQEKAARKILQDLIRTYPDSPLVANALLMLPDKSQQETTLIKEFPYHPLTLKIARQRLRQDPDRFELLMLLAKYSRDSDLNPIRDRLVLEYPAKLTSSDWEAIADGYWRSGEHRKAADAYIYADPTPGNLYRAAKGFHRNGNISSAKSAYQRLLREYHDATESGEALIDLASISSGDEAVVYLEKAIALFPKNAPQAYLNKAIIHERFGKHEAAKDSLQQLLSKYGDSAAAAQYRWTTATELARSGNKQDAWQMMQPVVKSNQEFNFAPKALYQTANWAKELNQTDAASATWKKIIELYPQTYWAWRSATKLGWVGDFTQLSSLSPTLDLNKRYSPLPAGSPALQELYLLGQNRDAWLLLQSEIEQPQRLTVDEQFTEGILKLELGRYSEGMQEIWDLTKRETPQDIQRWQALRQSSAYWYGLFPFPYQDKILTDARRNQINPLLVISVMRKESTFDPEIDSVVGAVGLMQIVPPTARWVAEKIELSDYSLTDPEDNIKIGSWYLKHNHQRYNNDSLLAVASYNAGTSNVNDWLNRYDIENRDRFVEQIPFPETKDYVEGVFGNYWNYLRLYNPEIRQKVENLRSPQPPAINTKSD